MGAGAISNVDCKRLWGYISNNRKQKERKSRQALLLLFGCDQVLNLYPLFKNIAK
jgi:hypothetical protein